MKPKGRTGPVRGLGYDYLKAPKLFNLAFAGCVARPKKADLTYTKRYVAVNYGQGCALAIDDA